MQLSTALLAVAACLSCAFAQDAPAIKQGDCSANCSATTDASGSQTDPLPRPPPSATRLFEIARPIIGATLHAELYEPGCDAAIYQCDATTNTASVLRFRNRDDIYDASQHSEHVPPASPPQKSTSRAGEGDTGSSEAFHPPQGDVPCVTRAPGDKRLAVLVHGFLACSQKWHDIAARLSREGFDVVLPLLPGHGVMPTQSPSPLHHVPADHPHTPVWSHDVGYGTVARAVADLVIAAMEQLDYAEILLGGFSAGGTVLTDALMLLASDARVTDEDFARLRIVHVATFLETPDKVIQLARDLHPLLWVNKLRMEGKWYDVERYSGHPWRIFQDRGRKGFLVTTRSHQMRLLRYITKVRRAFSKIRTTSRNPARRRAAALIQKTPVLAVVLLNDVTIVVDLLLDALARHHGAEGRLVCGLESNHPETEMCGTCCDEEHCSWFDEYDDRHPELGHLLHTPDCAHVGPDTDLASPEHHACGGSGAADIVPDGLNHDTLLDAQSRAGKPEGWWVPCNADVIVRFATADAATVRAVGTPWGAAALPCAVEPRCAGLARMRHTAAAGWGKKGHWEREASPFSAAADGVAEGAGAGMNDATAAAAAGMQEAEKQEAAEPVAAEA